MRLLLSVALLATTPLVAEAQARRFPPDSLVNTLVIPHNTPVSQVIGQMRNFAGDLGVRCQFCHVGVEGQPLDQFDFVKDEKQTKLRARQMMRMVQEINRRLDTLPGHTPSDPVVTCRTCHRGVSLPIPLQNIMANADSVAGVDSAMRAYRNLRARYYGSDAYDFGEPTLAFTAMRVARAGRIDNGLALLGLQEEYFPTSSPTAVFRGNILLMRADTNGAALAFREALRRDSTNGEARSRLRAIGRAP